ncbi:MAG: cytidylyltransferase domain-containing protein [Alphaproteobacteria bacterium]
MIVIVIPAKGASSRLANKNMTPINGRPMIDYAIDAALASKRAAAIYVSTDSDAIAAHCAARGIAVIRRPESLGGDVPIIEVYRHARAHIADGDKIDTIVGLQPDHPDRDIGIDEAIAAFEREKADVLNSTERDGTKNGAHYVLSRHFLDGGTARRTATIVDDCTNIHFERDLRRASERLAARRP